MSFEDGFPTMDAYNDYKPDPTPERQIDSIDEILKDYKRTLSDPKMIMTWDAKRRLLALQREAYERGKKEASND